MSEGEPTLRITCPRCWGWSGKVGMGEQAICPLCHYKWQPKSAFSDDWNFNKRLQPLADGIYKGIWHLHAIHRNLGLLDKERGIDVHLELSTGLTLDIQEKFRRASYRHFWEFTIEYKNNPMTNEQGEFYHLAANYYFYAYVDQREESFTDWWLVDLNGFKEAYNNQLVKEDEIIENKKRGRATALAFAWDKMSPFIKTSSRLEMNG